MWPFKRKHVGTVEKTIVDDLAAYPVHKPSPPNVVLEEVKRLRSIVAGLADQSNTTATHVDGIRSTLTTQLREVRDRLPDSCTFHVQTFNNIVSGVQGFPYDSTKHLPQDPTPVQHSDEYLRGVSDLREYVLRIIDGR